MKSVSVTLRGMGESKRDRKRRSRKREKKKKKNASPSWLLRGFHGGAAEVRGGRRARENREREDKSTAALSPSAGERPAVCAERPLEFND